jgi:hypothetical protein
MVAIMEFIRLDAHLPVPVRGRYTYYPNGAERQQGPMGIGGGRFFQLLVEIEISGDARGVICSQRSPCGGYSLFLRDGKLIFVHDDPGASPLERLVCDTPEFGKHIVGVEFTRQSGGRDVFGAVTLSVDSRPMAVAPLGKMPARFAACGEGLWIGCDGDDVIRGEYESRFPLVGARVIEVVFDVTEEAIVGGEHDRAVSPARH